MDKNEGTPQPTPESRDQAARELISARTWCDENRRHPAIGKAIQNIQSWAPDSLAVVVAWLRSVAGGEPPYTRCGKNMGNDLLVIPCDLAKGHDGPCERNVWPVVAGGEPEQKIAVAEFVLQCLQAGCTAGGIITAIREGKDVPAPPQGKEQK